MIAAPNVAPRARACAWCGSRLSRASEPPGIAVCGSCGVGNTDPAPSDLELARAYASWYRPESGRFGALGDALLRRSRSRLATRLDRLAPAGRVLDVGSGDGALLDALRKRGREPLGLERESSRPDVVAARVGDLEGDFSAIVFWHSLEHLREPAADLNDAARRLAPGGVLIVAVPNRDSLQARAFGSSWLALDLPRHLVHIPARALVTRLRELGLDVGRVSHLRGGQVMFGWLHGLVGSLPGDLDLYAAIRSAPARQRALGPARRLGTLAAGVALSPVAALLTLAEAALRRGGSVYVEARRPR